MESEYKHSAALYLLQDNYANNINSILPEEPRIALSDNVSLTGFILQFVDDPHNASWKGVVDYLSSNPLDVSSQRPGALVFIKHNANAYIISFGMGWRKIELHWIVLNFGKLVALNSIPYDQLSGLKLEQVLSTWHQSTEKSPQPSAASSFGMEYDRDLVHDVEGKPSGNYLGIFGAHIKGSDALHLSIDFKNIKTILDNAIERFNSSVYKNIWPEFNYMRIVSTQTEINQLDANLNAYLSVSENVDNLLLVCPLSKKADTEVPTFFWVGRKVKGKEGSTPPMSPYIYIQSWVNFLKDHNDIASTLSAKSTPVHLLDEGGQDITVVRLYDCICFQTSIDGKTYFLSGGKWHYADIAFIDEVDNYLPNIKIGKGGSLSSWNIGELEEDYNIRCCQEKGLWLFDQKMVMFGGGSSKFEICDLYDEKSKAMYFVKKISGSNNFSHFGEQVRNSLRLIYSPDQAFRDAAIKKLKTAHPTLDMNWLKERPRMGEIKIGLVSMSSGIDNFPFFAKLSLMKLHKELDLAGHDVEFFQV